MLPLLQARRYVLNLWDNIVEGVLGFFYMFLTDEQLADIEAEAEEVILDSTIKQRKIMNEMRQLLRQKFEDEGYDEEEIGLMVEHELNSLIERR